MPALSFVKMHGCGNDYVYVDGSRTALPEDPAALAALAARVSDRHYGVGGDGLILILPPTVAGAAVRMRMFNADGSEAEMCGNGVRCVAKYAYENGLAAGPSDSVRVEVGKDERRVLPIRVRLGAEGKVEAAEVDMGEPCVRDLDRPIEVREAGTLVAAFRASIVDMPNPHCVIFGREPADDRLVATIGPRIESHRMFLPARTNVEFACAERPDEVSLRVWERGSGETLACGTGACATVVAGAATGRTGRRVRVRLSGGALDIEWRAADGHVLMTGPCVEVFRGTLS